MFLAQFSMFGMKLVLYSKRLNYGSHTRKLILVHIRASNMAYVTKDDKALLFNAGVKLFYQLSIGRLQLKKIKSETFLIHTKKFKREN